MRGRPLGGAEDARRRCRARPAAAGEIARRHRPAGGARAVARPPRRAPGPHWDRLLFSIKESIYKAWFPLAERWLGFEDAVVSIDWHRESFSARLLVPGPLLDGRELRSFHGRWLAAEGLVMAAIALPAGRG